MCICRGFGGRSPPKLENFQKSYSKIQWKDQCWYYAGGLHKCWMRLRESPAINRAIWVALPSNLRNSGRLPDLIRPIVDVGRNLLCWTVSNEQIITLFWIIRAKAMLAIDEKVNQILNILYAFSCSRHPLNMLQNVHSICISAHWNIFAGEREARTTKWVLVKGCR